MTQKLIYKTKLIHKTKQHYYYFLQSSSNEFDYNKILISNNPDPDKYVSYLLFREAANIDIYSFSTPEIKAGYLAAYRKILKCLKNIEQRRKYFGLIK